jgi:hypothetical protein
MPSLHISRQSDYEAARLDLIELREQLNVLIGVSDTLRAHLETKRDQAALGGDTVAASAFEQGALQIARVRNDVWSACRDLDPARLGETSARQRGAA